MNNTTLIKGGVNDDKLERGVNCQREFNNAAAAMKILFYFYHLMKSLSSSFLSVEVVMKKSSIPRNLGNVLHAEDNAENLNNFNEHNNIS